MSLIEAIILGILQGLTEFLPVSSSGHLVLGQELLDIHIEGIAFEVFVHFGTLLSVLVIYRRDLLAMLTSLPRFAGNTGRIRQFYSEDRDFRWLLYIIIGSIPAGVIGLGMGAAIETAFNDAHTVAWMLMVTGTMLLLTRFGKSAQQDMSLLVAVLVGVAQALAIMPGISRSGATISVALFLGIARDESARFSFLLAIPVILGATLLKLIELLQDLPQASQLLNLFAGTLVAFITGYIAIKLLLMFIRRGKLDYFAWYCYGVGVLGLSLL